MIVGELKNAKQQSEVQEFVLILNVEKIHHVQAFRKCTETPVETLLKIPQWLNWMWIKKTGLLATESRDWSSNHLSVISHINNRARDDWI